jgi:hypothetical protein
MRLYIGVLGGLVAGLVLTGFLGSGITGCGSSPDVESKTTTPDPAAPSPPKKLPMGPVELDNDEYNPCGGAAGGSSGSSGGSTTPTCGGEGQACCPGNTCNQATLACGASGTCQFCGLPAEICCNTPYHDACLSPLDVCNKGSCCEPAGNPCVIDSACCSGSCIFAGGGEYGVEGTCVVPTVCPPGQSCI